MVEDDDILYVPCIEASLHLPVAGHVNIWPVQK